MTEFQNLKVKSMRENRVAKLEHKMGLEEVEDLTIHRQFVDRHGVAGDTLEIIISRKGMNKEQILEANAKALEIFNRS